MRGGGRRASVRYLVPEAVAATSPTMAVPRRTPVPEPRPDPPVTETRPRALTPRADGLPAREHAAAPNERAPLEVARRIVELAEDKKAADIVLLDLGELTTVADCFVICSGGSERQIAAIADGIVEALRDEGVRPIGREGTAESHWVLLDFGSVIVHVFTPPERDYYQLERHWAEAPDDPARPVGVGRPSLWRGVPAGAVRTGHGGAATRRLPASGQPRSMRRRPRRRRMSGFARSLPRLQPEAHHHALRHDLPTA